MYQSHNDHVKPDCDAGELSVGSDRQIGMDGAETEKRQPSLVLTINKPAMFRVVRFRTKEVNQDLNLL